MIPFLKFDCLTLEKLLIRIIACFVPVLERMPNFFLRGLPNELLSGSPYKA